MLFMVRYHHFTVALPLKLRRAACNRTAVITQPQTNYKKVLTGFHHGLQFQNSNTCYRQIYLPIGFSFIICLNDNDLVAQYEKL